MKSLLVVDVPGFPGVQARSDGRLVIDGVVQRESRQRGYHTTSKCVHGKQQRVHRLVCTAFHGPPSDPSLVVDHIDGNRSNNAPSNLRWCSISQNGMNRRGSQRNAKHGHLGVSWHKHTQRYRSQIRARKQLYDLGYFKSSVVAAMVRDMAAVRLHGEFASLNFPEWFSVR